MVRDTLEAWKRSGDMKESQAALKDWTVTSIQHMLRNDSPALAAHPDASISKGGQSCFAASVKEHVHKTFGLSTVSAGAAAHTTRPLAWQVVHPPTPPPPAGVHPTASTVRGCVQ